MDSTLLKYCKYYNGEDTNSNFSILEKNYISLDSEYHRFWETKGIELLKSFPEAYDYVMSFKDGFVRGMLANFVVLSYDHAPQAGTDFILEYGK